MMAGAGAITRLGLGVGWRPELDRVIEGADLGFVERRRRERRPTPPKDGSDRIRALDVVIDAIDRARTVGVTHETIASEMDNFTTDRTKDDLA
ncbi:MAG: hypothetical protein QOF69_2506 [Solirubrobacteraceae bacterium]|nr:hypothetical protein [Solirubrobacteraceae bacterium]